MKPRVGQLLRLDPPRRGIACVDPTRTSLVYTYAFVRTCGHLCRLFAPPKCCACERFLPWAHRCEVCTWRES